MLCSEIVQELRSICRGGYKQPVAGTRACDVKEVPFGVVHLFKVGFVSYGLNTRLQGNDLVDKQRVVGRGSEEDTSSVRRMYKDWAVTLTGIDNRSITSEQHATSKTLSLCLMEIQKCRPFFIEIFGNRCG